MSVINEKFGIFDVVFLAEFTEKDLAESRSVRGKETDVQKSVCLGSDSRVQPILLIIDPNHALVDRDLSRRFTAVGLEISLLHPVVNGFWRALDTQLFENWNGIPDRYPR